MFNWFKKKKNIIPQKPKNIPLPPTIPQRVSLSSFPALKRSEPELAQQQITPTDDGLLTSMAIGYVLNDGLVGGLICGNIAGGIIGDSLNTDEEKPDKEPLEVSQPDNNNDLSSSYESSSNYDNSSSYDSGSSYDSSSGSSSYSD